MEECLPPHTFNEDTLTLEELRAIATRPFRFLFAMQTPLLSAARRKPTSPRELVVPLRNTLFLPELEATNPGTPELLSFQSHVLLPGGRWLVTASSNEEIGYTELCCWDLENFGAECATHRLRKVLAIHEDLVPSSVMMAQSDPDHDRVVLVVRTWDFDGQ